MTTTEEKMFAAITTRGLTSIQRSVYAYLIGRIETEGDCTAGVGDIAADLYISPRRVMMATRRLHDTQRIVVTKRQRDTNLYSLGARS